MAEGFLDDISPDAAIENVLQAHKPTANPIAKIIWVCLGSVFVVFAYIGTLLPGWPTVSWLVLSAFCFARSSKTMFKWLLTNPVFGKALLNYYQNGKALPFHSKVLIIGMISIVSASSIWFLFTKTTDPGYGQGTIALVAVIGVWFVGWKVPTIE
ncbi:MAG: YbaN family protein [Candidatus Poseidoniaceae archaeon]|jgi:hypothetical protein|nr:YbaN family protein [Candidatus Poseidoniaceae archaeon]